MRSVFRSASALVFSAAVVAPVFYFSGCNLRAPEGSRGPSSTFVSSMIPVPSDLAAASGQFLDFVRGEQFTAQNCGPILKEIYERMYRIDAKYFDKDKAIRDADTVLKNLWESKLALRKRLGEFLDKGVLSKTCVDSTREILRAGRYIEDYVGYLKVKPAPFDKKNVREAYSGGYPHLMVNADTKSMGFKSGDILMSRGTAFTSAAIARIGDVDAQFSHLAILYIDEKTGKKYTVEAHIEIGVKTFTLEEYLKDGKARAVLFRYHDAELAHRAAKLMFEEANKHTAAGENIPYDFGMVMFEPSELFCSEVVQHAFQLAAKELRREFRIPLFPTSMTMRNRDFLDGIGVKGTVTFAPADMEVDPRVELVAEWRDYSRVRLLHRHDATLMKIYDWMERFEYKMHGDLLTWIKKHVVWSMRRWPLFSSLLKDKFPKNMSADALGTMVKLNSVSEAMFTDLEKADEEHFKQTGLPMTPKDMEAFLDEMREEDLKVYREYRDCQQMNRGGDGEGGGGTCNLPLPKFHWDFRPRDED